MDENDEVGAGGARLSLLLTGFEFSNRDLDMCPCRGRLMAGGRLLLVDC